MSRITVGVKTTRALSVVGTGQEIRRPWYAASSKDMMESGGSKRSRHPPNILISEPGQWILNIEYWCLPCMHCEGGRRKRDSLTGLDYYLMNETHLILILIRILIPCIRCHSVPGLKEFLTVCTVRTIRNSSGEVRRVHFTYPYPALPCLNYPHLF